MTSTIGLLLVIILSLFEDRGLVVDWIDYYESALRHGMQTDRVLSRIDSDVVDVLGSEHRDEVLKRLRFYISRK